MKPSLSASLLDDKTRFRVQIKHAVAIGPGKADVLEGIAATGSLAETGRRLGMSYQRVWSLVGAMNLDFVEPLVLKQRGGAAGGGAQLTPVGQQVLATYRAIERDAQRAVSKRLPQLLALIRAEASERAALDRSARIALPAARRLRGAPAKVGKFR
jgi:molybdate transport system regulatory protein